jgi:hypothetical protein
MVARYGLDGRPAATYAEVGASLGLTKQRICQLHTEALVWLRQPAHSHMLRSLLDRHFDGLRPVLACRLGWTSARGYMPFDPVSSFLLLGWQITHRWTRAQTLRNLADPRYAD